MAIRKHVAQSGLVTYFVYVVGPNDSRIYVGKARTKEDARTLERKEKEHQWKLRNGLATPDTKKTFSELSVPWVEERLRTHRRGCDDQWRLKKHLIPFLGSLTPREITVAKVKDLLQYLRSKGTGKTTMRACIRLLGRFLAELVEEGSLASNPISRLDRHTRRQFKPDHDPRKTPFLRSKEAIRKVYLQLPDEEIRTLFAVGAFAGLRTGEILGLKLEDVDLARRRILVQRSYDTITKDEEPRIVPITDTLLPILSSWIEGRDAEQGLVFPPTGHGRFIRPHRLRQSLAEALKAAKLPPLTWYQATRHTFASHWVMDGRAIEKLRDILGHSSVDVTERYAHLSPEVFSPADYAAVSVDLRDPKVVNLPPRSTPEEKATGTKAEQWEESAPSRASK
jgi:integrase